MSMMLKLAESVPEIVADACFSGLNCWIKKPSLIQKIGSPHCTHRMFSLFDIHSL